jgi:hypothetical protein
LQLSIGHTDSNFLRRQRTNKLYFRVAKRGKFYFPLDAKSATRTPSPSNRYKTFPLSIGQTSPTGKPPFAGKSKQKMFPSFNGGL